jgi:hypothetical protein
MVESSSGLQILQLMGQLVLSRPDRNLWGGGVEEHHWILSQATLDVLGGIVLRSAKISFWHDL